MRGWLLSIDGGPDELLAVPSGQLLPGSRNGADDVQPGLILTERQCTQLHTVCSRLVSERLGLDELRDVPARVVL